VREGLSIVVPVFNSEESLPKLLQELSSELPQLAHTYEVILVNDGSRDGSWRIVEGLAQEFSFVRGFDLMRNYGQHNALLVGVRNAKHDVIVTMDDDLQHPPAEVAALLRKLDEGFDVVYGTPREMQHDFLRNIASRMTKLVLQSAMGAKTASNISAFRAFRTHLRDAFVQYQNPFVSIDVLLTWGTTKFVGTPVRHEPRLLGQSAYTLRKLFTHAANMVTGFSAMPLQLATWTGFAFTLFGIGVFLFVFVRYLISGTPVPGFPFLGSLVSIFSGAQMFALGIIGEYLSRMHGRLLDKPAYAVRVTTDTAAKPS
jgi:glycosyltransferase involved in cell wall biosynthesis